MRIRSIHPEFWRSGDVAAMEWSTRLVFIGLWSYVDDNGVGRDSERLIVSDVFPLEEDPRDTLATVSRALATLSFGGQITRYTVAGKPYLHLTNWDKWQRIDKPGKPRYPPPTSDDAIARETVATPSRDSRDTLAPGEGEKGRRGEVSSSPIADAIADPEDAPREDVGHLCSLLADLVEKNGAKRPTITKAWRDAARLLLDRDGRDPGQAARLITWCQADEFWRSNVLSMPKFRDKYDQLLLKAQSSQNVRRLPVDSGHPKPAPREAPDGPFQYRPARPGEENRVR